MTAKSTLSLLLVFAVSCLAAAEERDAKPRGDRPAFGQPRAEKDDSPEREGESVQALIGQLRVIVGKLKSKGLSDEQIRRLLAAAPARKEMSEDKAKLVEQLRAKGLNDEQIKAYLAGAARKEAAAKANMVQQLRAKGYSDAQIKQYYQRMMARKQAAGAKKRSAAKK